MLKSSAQRYRAERLGGGAGSAVHQRTRRGAPRSTSGRPPIGPTAGDPVTRVEAALFLAAGPLTLRKLAALADLPDGSAARVAVEELRHRLRRRGSALQAVEVAGGVQLLTRPQLADWLIKLHGPQEQLRLSPPALETLAVAAYRQPVLRAEIEAIRGVQCGELLRLLMDRGFLRIVGRSEELGRPILYGTTPKFLQVFGLRRLEELPPIDQTLGTAAVGASPSESLDL